MTLRRESLERACSHHAEMFWLRVILGATLVIAGIAGTGGGNSHPPCRVVTGWFVELGAGRLMVGWAALPTHTGWMWQCLEPNLVEVNGRVRMICAPLGAVGLAGLLGLLPGTLARHRAGSRARRLLNRMSLRASPTCPSCRYDLAGLRLSSRCPECGLVRAGIRGLRAASRG